MSFTDIWNICPMPAEGAMICGEGWRVTVLTERLLRLEYDPEGRFCDTATQTVIDRAFPLPDFRAEEKDGWLTVETDALRLEASCALNRSALGAGLGEAAAGLSAAARCGPRELSTKISAQSVHIPARNRR